MDNGKDTVYVDVDDEITGIIDKVTGSKQKIVALILPKRAAVLQSAVNMKLLKRSADNSGKKVVLITTESALLPLAGAAGIHVAKTPTSKPEVPVNPVIHDNNEPIDEDEPLELDDEPEEEVTAASAGKKPVGELAGDKKKVGKTPAAIETVELDDAETPAKAAAATDAASKKAAKKTPTKVPNFNKFQKKIAIAVALLVILIVGLIFANIVLPKATIAIATDATDYNSNLDVTLDSTASKVSTGTDTVPATISQQQKTYTQQANATGQQNNGDKATGSVKFTASKCSGSGNPADIAAGTVVSASGSNYITQEAASFSFDHFSAPCAYYKSGNVDITAQKPGASYNTGSATFSVSGRSDASGTGSASGGTDDIQKVVAQSDIDGAKNQIASQDTSAIKTALEQQIRGNNLYPMVATFSGGTPNVTSSANAGDSADNVTVTEAVTYTMYGVKRDYLDTLIKNDIKQQIDPSKQTILDDGLDKATIKVGNTSDTTNVVNIATTATVGPNLDLNSFKDEVKGKKVGYVKSLIGNQPGVTGVNVKLSPFWVSSVPKKASKITITVGKSTSSDDSSQ